MNKNKIFLIIASLIAVLLFFFSHPWLAVGFIMLAAVVKLFIGGHPILGTVIGVVGLIIFLILKLTTGIIGTIVSWFF
jgi:hypothetical protein